MYSLEQRKLAVETLVKFGHSCAGTIAEPGYPNRHSLYSWRKDCRECGEVRPGKPTREPRFTPEMKQATAEHYLEHGKNPDRFPPLRPSCRSGNRLVNGSGAGSRH